MSILIRGMEMPKGNEPITLFIYPDRKAVVCGRLGPLDNYEAVPVPDHGRLIDADAMEKLMSDTVQGDIRQYPYSDTLWEMAFKWIDYQPTIIPADPAEEGE